MILMELLLPRIQWREIQIENKHVEFARKHPDAENLLDIPKNSEHVVLILRYECT